jgi:opacity protein-like surface antigen
VSRLLGERESLVKRVLISASAVLFTILSGESSAGAQGASGAHLGLSGAAVFPTGAASDSSIGWGGSLMAIFNPPDSFVSVRAEGMYSGMEPNYSGGATRTKISSGTASVVVSSRGLSERPYFIGGVGVYTLDFSSFSRDATFSGKHTEFGWNVGGGIAFPLKGGSSIFVEARYHSVQTADRFTFIPVSIGFVF